MLTLHLCEQRILPEV